MVSSVTSNPYSYLSQLQGATPSPSATTSGSGTSTTSTPTVAGTAASTAQSLVSSLLSGGSFAPEVLSLLQQNSSGSFDPVTSLLGGSGTNDAITSLYANLYNTVESADIQSAKSGSTAPTSGNTPTAQTNTVDSIINSQTQASVAYNQTNQQNAQAVLAANSYGADGRTPLVS